MNVLIDNNLKPKKQQLNNLLEKIDLTPMYKKKDSLLIDSFLPTPFSLLSSNGSSMSSIAAPVPIIPIIPTTPSQSSLSYPPLVDNYNDGHLQSNLYSMLTSSSVSTNPYNNQQQQFNQIPHQHNQVQNDNHLFNLDKKSSPEPRYKKFKTNLISSHFKNSIDSTMASVDA